MQPAKGGNPASKYAVTLARLQLQSRPTKLIICSMEERGRGNQRVVDLVAWVHAQYLWQLPSFVGQSDRANGPWLVFDRDLNFAPADTLLVPRESMARPGYAYDPARLGLVPYARSRQWNEDTCVIMPRHSADIRREYPRKR